MPGVPVPEQARKWQQRLDAAFPHGCVIAADGSPHLHSYPVARPEVVSMKGVAPVVLLELSGWGRNFSGAITGWEELQDKPCKMVRVTFEHARDLDDVMLWSGNISPGQAKLLAKERQESLQLSAEGRLYQGPHWAGDVP